MADYDSSLPVQTITNGDVVVKIADGTTNTQLWYIDTAGIGQVNLNDGTSSLVLTTGGGVTSTIYDSTGANAWEIDGNNLGPVKVTNGTNELTIDASGFIGGVVYDSTGANAWEIDGNNLGPVKVTDGTNDLTINAGGSINVNVVQAVVANEYHYFNTTTGTAPNTPTNVVNQTVVATTALILKGWSVACAGRAKAELKTGPTGSEATRAVAFISTAGGTWEGHFDSPIEVVNGDKVLVVMTNRDNANTDLYAWVNGNLV
jgi:hypothetical protein